MSFVCPCGCDLRLSPRDAAMERWLEEIAGYHTGQELPISLAVQRSVSRHDGPEEPTTTLRCKCDSNVDVATYIAEFLDRWGMGSPSCVRCYEKARAA